MAGVTVERRGDVAWVTVDSPPVNATTTPVRQGLMDAVARVQGARLAVLQCAGATFVAGGDMREFDRPAEPPHLPDVVDAIEQSATPFVAALHGTVLGGGWEIAMGCAFRVAAPGTTFGLPEVNVGLIPGAGGTQRTPRLLGWDAAVAMAVNGARLDADQMLDLGGIDAISGDVATWLETFDQPRPTAVSARPAAPTSPDFWETARAEATRKAKGQTAPLDNLRALEWAALPFADGQVLERALHLDLRQSAQARALRHVFFGERAVAKPDAIHGIKAEPVQRIAIVGGGLMGSGIAAAALMAGAQVTVLDTTAPRASAAQDRIQGLLDGADKRGKLRAPPDQVMAQLHTTCQPEDLAQADLVIEAVFEDLATKQQVFQSVAQIVRDDAILATNTSYLDPRLIFDGIPGPDRQIGLHFFAPAHVMKLLEVVRTPGTSAATLATAFRLAKDLRKIPVLAGVCDGFIGNRMLAALRRAAEYLLADGALPQDIDRAMRGFGMAMGPFEAQDLSGLDIALAHRRRQDSTRDPRQRYVTISDQLCALGRLGQKTGRGWYDYAPGQRTPRPSDQVQGVIETFAKETWITRRSFSDDDITTTLLAALANEGARIVEDGIADSPVAVDIVQVRGFGFPAWRGGPMHWAADQGDAAVRAVLAQMQADSPNSWVLAKRYRP